MIKRIKKGIKHYPIWLRSWMLFWTKNVMPLLILIRGIMYLRPEGKSWYSDHRGWCESDTIFWDRFTVYLPVRREKSKTKDLEWDFSEQPVDFTSYQKSSQFISHVNKMYSKYCRSGATDTRGGYITQLIKKRWSKHYNYTSVSHT